MIKEQIIVTKLLFLYIATNPMGTMLDYLYTSANLTSTGLNSLY